MVKLWKVVKWWKVVRWSTTGGCSPPYHLTFIGGKVVRGTLVVVIVVSSFKFSKSIPEISVSQLWKCPGRTKPVIQIIGHIELNYMFALENYTNSMNIIIHNSSSWVLYEK